jgi:hypothetical protein
VPLGGVTITGPLGAGGGGVVTLMFGGLGAGFVWMT